VGQGHPGGQNQAGMILAITSDIAPVLLVLSEAANTRDGHALTGVRADRKQGDQRQAEARVVANQTGQPLALRQDQELDHRGAGQQRRRNRQRETSVSEATAQAADTGRDPDRPILYDGPATPGHMVIKRQNRAGWPIGTLNCSRRSQLQFPRIVFDCLLVVMSVAQNCSWPPPAEPQTDWVETCSFENPPPLSAFMVVFEFACPNPEFTKI
jgi:hypothetical protein